MKTLQILGLVMLIAIGISCKEEPRETTVEQQEMGTLPDTSADTVAPPPIDSLKSAQTP